MQYSTKTVGIDFLRKAAAAYLKHEENQKLISFEQSSDGMIRIDISFSEIINETPIVVMHPVKITLLQKIQIVCFRFVTTVQYCLQY